MEELNQKQFIEVVNWKERQIKKAKSLIQGIKSPTKETEALLSKENEEFLAKFYDWIKEPKNYLNYQEERAKKQKP